MNAKEQIHNDKIKALSKYFKKLKAVTILVWLLVNVAVDVTTFLIFSKEHIELFIFSLALVGLISTLLMVNMLNRQDKMRISQESQLIEEAPLGRLKF